MSKFVECPRCYGDGFIGWTQAEFRRKKRIYKKLCPLCRGKEKVDWVTAITLIEKQITNAKAYITDKLSERLGNYCFSTRTGFGQKCFVNKEFCKFKDIDKKRKYVITDGRI